MPTYEVEVIRYSYGFYNTTIETGNQEEAERKAIEEACNQVIPDSNADYEIRGTREVDKEDA